MVSSEHVIKQVWDSLATISLTAVAIFVAYIIWYRSKVGHAAAKDLADKKKAAAAVAQKTYTREEVARHAQRDDCWIILKSQEDHVYRVFDVTKYVDEHPGGDKILDNAGRDSTKGFHGPQHPPRVFDLIGDFCIGNLKV